MHLSWERIDLIIPQIDRLEFGSSPEEGSSRNMNLDFPIKAFANESFLLFPPDKFFESFSFYASKLHSCIIDAIYWWII